MEDGLQKFARRWFTSNCLEIYEGFPLPRERNALQFSHFRFRRTINREALLFKKARKLGLVEKTTCGSMKIFSPTLVVADDICDAKLAIERGK
jgi:hypothetical protein